MWAFVTLVRKPGERTMGQLLQSAAAGGSDIRGDQRSRYCNQHSKTLADAYVQKYYGKLRGVDDHIFETVTVLCLLVTRSVRS